MSSTLSLPLRRVSFEGVVVSKPMDDNTATANMHVYFDACFPLIHILSFQRAHNNKTRTDGRTLRARRTRRRTHFSAVVGVKGCLPSSLVLLVRRLFIVVVVVVVLSSLCSSRRRRDGESRVYLVCCRLTRILCSSRFSPYRINSLFIHIIRTVTFAQIQSLK